MNGQIIGALIAMLLATGCLGSSVFAVWMNISNRSDFLAVYAFLTLIGTGLFGVIAVIAAVHQ